MCCFLKTRQPPISTLTDTLCPYTTLFRSVEERPRLVHGVEALGLLAAHVYARAGDDAEAGLLEAVDDLARDVAPGGIRLDDRKGSFDGHGLRLSFLVALVWWLWFGGSGLVALADCPDWRPAGARPAADSCFSRSEEHTSELQSLMRISYAVFCLKKKNN